jgi:repressor LexA
MAELKDRIKERRLASGLTLLQVADKLGVKEATVQRYESGEIKNVKHEIIEELAKIFNCRPEYLMGWSDQLIRLSEYSKSLTGVDYIGKAEKAGLIPETIAAHKEDNENWTAEELQKMEDYKQLLLAARKNQK